jgi:hypothetical protein
MAHPRALRQPPIPPGNQGTELSYRLRCSQSREKWRNSSLDPDPKKNWEEFFTLPGVSQAIQDELEDEDAEVDFTDWTFDYDGPSLNGTLTIDQYRAEYVEAHVGGAKIEARYEKGEGDPENLRWIQLVVDNAPFDPDGDGPLPVYTPPVIDGDFDSEPFYWLDTEIGGHSDGSTDWGDYDLHFSDFSKRRHPLPVPFEPITWRAELYLVSWDGETKEVTFHDGIQWGWVMYPLPTLGGLGILLYVAVLISSGSSFIRRGFAAARKGSFA